MTRFIPRSIATAVILAAATACGHAVPAPPPIPFYEPDVALRDVRLRGVGLFGGTLDLWMRVYNPNTYDIMSPRVGYVVVVDQVQVASGFADLDVVVPARDSVEVRVPAAFRYSDLGPAGRAIVGQGAAMYHVMGRVTVGTPYGRRSFPYDRAGQYGMVDARLGPPRRDDPGYARDARDARGHEHYDRDGHDSREQAYDRDGRDHDGRDHDGGDPPHAGGREHEPGLVPVQGPPPRDRHDGVGDEGDHHDQGRAHEGDAPCRDSRSDARANDPHGPCGSGPAEGPVDHPGPSAPPNDTPRGPDGHQPVRVGPPGEGRHPGPVPPIQPPRQVEHPVAPASPAQPALPAPPARPAHPAHPEHPAHPVHPAHPEQPGQAAPGSGTSAPTSHDSSAHPARRGGKPCPPPEPKGRGVEQQNRRVPPPCAVPDSGGKGKHEGPAHTQR